MDTREQNLKHKKLHRITKAHKVRHSERGGGGILRAMTRWTKINGRFYNTIFRITNLQSQVTKPPLVGRGEGEVIPEIQE